jgi:hypothetical protein
LTNNIQQQQQRKLSGPGLGGPGAQNGSALTTGGFGVPPQFAAAAAVAAGAGANPPSPTQPTDVAGLQAQLTARLMQQAAALRQAQTAAGMAGQQPAPPGAPANLPDWASAAAASGMLTNMGTDREAIMKQVSSCGMWWMDVICARVGARLNHFTASCL